MPDLFDANAAEAMVARIAALTEDSQPQWGKMSVSQMLAHCCKPFETVYDPAYMVANPRPRGVMRLVLRYVVKPMVTGDRPYRRNMRTAPAFIVSEPGEFAVEQQRLIGFIRRVNDEGAGAFEGRDNHSFGPLTAREWSTLFYKHTDHHLVQFGV